MLRWAACGRWLIVSPDRRTVASIYLRVLFKRCIYLFVFHVLLRTHEFFEGGQHYDGRKPGGNKQ